MSALFEPNSRCTSASASGTTTLTYRVRIDLPMPDGTQVTARARVASQETAAFALESASLVVRAVPDFDDDRTTFSIEPAHDVRPGGRVSLNLTTFNAGSAAAEAVTATFEIPDSLIPVRGGSRIDGRPIRAPKKEQLVFELGRIDAGESADVQCEAIVTTPLPDGSTLDVVASVAWQPARDGSLPRRLERVVTIHAQPSLAARRNGLIRSGSDVTLPGSEVEMTIALGNDGSAAATDAVLHLRIDPAFDDLRIMERSTRLTLDGDTVELGSIEPYAQRRLTVRARVRTPYADRSELKIGASLHTRELSETPLGDVVWRVDSHPGFEPASSTLKLAKESVLRPNQLADVNVHVHNTGTDIAHNVRVRLYVSPEARLESVDGATREKSKLVFGEVAPGTAVEARLGLRLLRSLAREYPVTLDAVLTADAMLPVPLERLTIATSAAPDFSVGTFHSDPIDVVDVGETIEWTLHVRNGGDGPARRVLIKLTQPDSLIYVPNSTSVNDVPMRDFGTRSALTSDLGIALNDVDPGVEATLRFQEVVHNGLSAGEEIVRVAKIEYDGELTDEIASNSIKVRAIPAFANAIPGLPFGLDGMIGPSFGAMRALTEERYLELPPATPVNGETSQILESTNFPALTSLEGAIGGDHVGIVTAFSNERLAHALRFLREARFDGMVTHLFAIRALFPDAIGDTQRTTVTAMRDGLREELDRLYIKLQIPRYVIAPRDVETRSLRASLERLLHDAADSHGVPVETPGATSVLRGAFDPSMLHDLAEQLAEFELATALPWAIMARLLPESTAQLAHYRTLLVERLDAFVEAESSEFIDALQRRREVALDGALDVVCASLGNQAGE